MSASRPLPASCRRESINKDSGLDGVIVRTLVPFDTVRCSLGAKVSKDYP
jgi:hypothetical protein